MEELTPLSADVGADKDWVGTAGADRMFSHGAPPCQCPVGHEPQGWPMTPPPGSNRRQRVLRQLTLRPPGSVRKEVVAADAARRDPVQGAFLGGDSSAAFSSQKFMPISRYIVLAVVRCSSAFAWSPVLR